MDLRRVLVIEDDPDVASVLELALRRMGVPQVLVAPDGVVGLHQARTGGFDLLLVDLLLPGRDGWDIVRELRQEPALADTAMVFVTSAARALAPDAVRGSGADGLICKPFTVAGLATRIEAILARRRRLHGA